MIMDIKKIQSETKRLPLYLPADYKWIINNRFDLIEDVVNGVGSETSWTYHLTPDTIWGLNINPSSHIHDWMYTFPFYFSSVADGLAWKQLADHWFDLNVRAQIEDGLDVFEYIRTLRLKKIYNPALGAAGSKAFWKNKQLPPDYEFYYSGLPEMEPEKMEEFRKIQEKIPKEFKQLSNDPTI